METIESWKQLAKKGIDSYCSLFLTNYSLILINLRNAYLYFPVRTDCVARVKAVELRQKNRDELLSEIENYKKELSQVLSIEIVLRSSVWLR